MPAVLLTGVLLFIGVDDAFVGEAALYTMLLLTGEEVEVDAAKTGTFTFGLETGVGELTSAGEAEGAAGRVHEEESVCLL